MTFVHAASAFIYSALALTETFIFLAVVICLFAFAVRAIFRVFRND